MRWFFEKYQQEDRLWRWLFEQLNSLDWTLAVVALAVVKEQPEKDKEGSLVRFKGMIPY